MRLPFYSPLLLTLFSVSLLGNANPITLTILYDNTAAVDEFQTEWGFACLVEGLEQTILFDTGMKSEVLLHNALVLGKDPDQIDVLVLSHDHHDHTGGMTAILERNPGMEVYLPHSFPAEYDATIHNHDAEAVRVSDTIEIAAGVGLSGELGSQIREQSLILKTAEGLVIITGCSHPGIVEILEHTTELYEQDIYLVTGGFHLLRHTDEQVMKIIARFKELGIKKVGATHCTGERAIELFRQAYGDNFIPMGVGQVLPISGQ